VLITLNRDGFDPERLLKKGIGILVELPFAQMESAFATAMEERLGTIRTALQKLTKNIWFDRTIAFIIVANAVRSEIRQISPILTNFCSDYNVY